MVSIPAVPKDASGNTPKWVIYGAGGVGAFALFMYLRNKQTTNGSTVSAGTSINAALGSIQEQQLQTQGDVSKAQVGITQVQTGISQIQAEQASQDLTSTAQFSNVNAGIGWLGNNQAAYNKQQTAQETFDTQGLANDISAQHLAAAASGTH